MRALLDRLRAAGYRQVSMRMFRHAPEAEWGPAYDCARDGMVGLGAGALVLLGALDNGVKILVARPRPPLVWQAMPAHGASFPSGHALWSAGVVLIVVVLLGARRGRPVLVALAVLVAAPAFSAADAVPLFICRIPVPEPEICY